MKCRELVDCGPEKSWLNFVSDPEHRLGVEDTVSLPIDQSTAHNDLRCYKSSNEFCCFHFHSLTVSKYRSAMH